MYVELIIFEGFDSAKVYSLNYFIRLVNKRIFFLLLNFAFCLFHVRYNISHLAYDTSASKERRYIFPSVASKILDETAASTLLGDSTFLLSATDLPNDTKVCK